VWLRLFVGSVVLLSLSACLDGGPTGACIVSYLGDGWCNDYTENSCERLDEDEDLEGEYNFEPDTTCNDEGYTEQCGGGDAWYRPSSIMCEDD
jgi:hypothetical protein